MKKILAKLGGAVAGVGAVFGVLANSVHAQILSATDGNTIVATTQTAANSFLTTTLPLVLIGLVILSWVFKMYRKVRKGR